MCTLSLSSRKLVFALSLAALLCLPLGACAQSTPAVNQTNTITVTARGTVKVVPDLASFTASIRTQASDAATAQSENAAPTNAVIARLKELGVPDESIQTTYADVSPMWTEDNEELYEAYTVLSIENVSVDKASALMEACVEEGATDVGSLQFYSSGADATYEDALAAAIEAARPKAEVIAKASGVTLGEVVAVVEGYQDTRYYTEEASSDTAADVDAGAQIEPGQVPIEAEVTVSFAIK